MELIAFLSTGDTVRVQRRLYVLRTCNVSPPISTPSRSTSVGISGTGAPTSTGRRRRKFLKFLFARSVCEQNVFSSLQANRIECLRAAVTIQIKYAAKYRWIRHGARISASSRRPPTTPNPSSALHCCPSCSFSVTITRTADIEQQWNESAADNSANRPKDSMQQNRRGYACLASLRTFFLPVLIIPTKVTKPKVYTRVRISVLLSLEFLLSVRVQIHSYVLAFQATFSSP